MKISCWRKKHTMKRLYDRGEKKLNKRLNITKILMRVNELILIVHQQKLKDIKSHWIFKHSSTNVIKCDTDSEYVTSDS